MRSDPGPVRPGGGRSAALAGALLLLLLTAAPVAPQIPDVRERLADLRVRPLSFDPPEPELREVAGVSVFFLRDPSVPLVDVLARFEGGYGRFPRAYLGAGTAIPALLRYGGAAGLAPDSVDRVLEFYALQTTFGGGGESVFASLNTLTEHLEVGLGLWGAMLRDPAFDSAEVEVWRGREVDAVRRRPDDPQRLAYGTFNRLLYGDHPVGWELSESDLEPEDLAPERLRFLHRRILCRDNLVLGVTGDVTWERVEPLLRGLLSEWPPCPEPLPPSPVPDIREGGGVFVLPRPLEQSVLVMAHPTDVSLGGPGYFAAQIGNSILGAGGFSSRLLSRVRTQEGYAYSAASLWTTPRRYRGLVGAVTRTRPENAAPAMELILRILGGMGEEPPTEDEVATSVAQIANGYVFNFETAAQVVSRRMSFLAQELPDDWLERYLEGIQEVTPAGVRQVFDSHVHPEEMTVLVVGDPARMDLEAMARHGPVTFLDETGRQAPPPPG